MTAAVPQSPTGRQIELAAGAHRAVVVEVGAGLRSYSVGDLELLDGYGPDQIASCGRGQVLVPWPNRLAEGRYTFGGEEHQLALSEPETANAIHGLVRFGPWEVAEISPDRAVLTHRLYPHPGYPWMLDVEIEYHVTAEGLRVRTTATNLSATACPYGAGAHPYLRLRPPVIDGLVLRSPARTRLVADAHGIPTGLAPVEGDMDFRQPRPIGAIRLDTGFTDLDRDAAGRAVVDLRDPDTDDMVSVWMDEAYPFLMLYTEDAVQPESGRRRGLAIEPMTCAPDAFRSGHGLIVLEPGGSHTGTWGISGVRHGD